MDALLLRPVLLAAASLLLGACAAIPAAWRTGDVPAAGAPGTSSTYRCDGDLRVQVRYESDGVTLEGLPGGPDQLFLDAGGLTPQQRVYSGPRLRAEFGLDADGSAAVLQLLQPEPASLRCTRA